MLLTRKIIALMVTALCVLTAGAAARFYTADQLSSNLITGICQDRQGYIWIGTEYGLNKFDGIRFTHYFHDDTDANSIGGDNILRMLTDSGGRLWLLTYSTVACYDDTTDRFVKVDLPADASNLVDLCFTSDGRLMLLTHEALFEIDVASMKAHLQEAISRQIKDGNVVGCYIDRRGHLWIRSPHALADYDLKSGRCRRYGDEVLQGAISTGIAEDQAGILYVVTNQSVLRHDALSGDLHHVLDVPRDLSARRVYTNKAGQLLMGSFGRGIYRLNIEAGRVEPIYQWTDLEVDFLQQKVNSFLEDRDGNIWLGCFQSGVIMLPGRPYPFRYLDLEKAPFSNGHLVRSAFTDHQDRFFLEQEQGGMMQLSAATDTQGPQLQNRLLDKTTVMRVHEDRHHQLWAATFRNGLCRLDPATGHPTWLLNDGDRITDITEDRQGNIYAARFNGTLHSFDPVTLQERTLCGGQMQLMNPFLNVLLTDSKGLIWIGTYYGVELYDPAHDKMVPLQEDSILRRSIVHAIIESADGTLWMGSSKGLFSYHREKQQWHRYSMRDGLSNDFVCGLAEDSSHQLWVSTYHGLNRLDPKTGRIVNFYRGNGLAANSYLRSVYGITKSGIVYFGNDKGLTYFNPDDIQKNEFQRGITLTGFDVNGISHQTTDLISMSHLSMLSLRLSPMDYREMENVYFEYRMAGSAGNAWNRLPAGVSEISFAQMQAGSYRLQVRACDGGIYSAVKEIAIYVSPPWYRTWGAYIFYLLAILGIGALWWRNYWNRKQADINEEKIKFFVDISHELRSPLTLIKSPLDSLLSASHDPQTTRALRNMERNTNRLLTLLNHILSIRKIEKGQMQLHFAETPLGDFISDICHDYDYQVEKRKIALTFTNEAPDMKVWIDRDNFDKVVTNLIGNAIKYVEDGGKIEVVVRQSADGQAELLVRDNGQGIDEKQLRKVFERFYQASARPAAGQMSYGIGLNLTYKIVNMHKGTIIARNRTDQQGSEFIVWLPLGTQHLPQDQLVDADYYASTAAHEEHHTLATDADQPRRVRKKTTYHVAVVDDDEEMRHFLQTELGETYHVHAYPDGQKALEGIVDTVPDLVVTDVVMPNIDGIELLKRLKASTKTSHIPVILLTTKTEHQSRVEGLEQGADAYVDKPFNLEELEARIASLIANRIRVRGKFSGMQEQEDTVRKVELKGNDATLMEKIMKAVNARIDDSDFNVEALAEEVGLSRVQLHRRMKELTGITVGEFIRNLRLQQAAKLLEKGDTTIAQVTYAVGFANPTHFASAFKKHFGVTPSEYMAKHQSKE